MRGFTLTELIVAVAIIGLLAVLGVRYYFTNVQMYRFQNALSEFTSSVNLARIRSMSGRVVSSTGVTGITPGAVRVTQIACSGNTMTLTTATPHNFTAESYVTLHGIRPTNLTSFTDPKLYSINGRLFQVTGIGGDGSTSLTLQFLNQHPANYLTADTNWSLSLAATPVNPSAYVFLKYAVRITPVSSVDGGGYAKASETGSLMTFQYNQKVVGAAFETPPGTQKSQPWTILFDKGLTVASQTYKVTFTLLSSGAVVGYTILPAGAVR